MAYDEHLADRIRQGFAELHATAQEKKMMGARLGSIRPNHFDL